MGPNQALASLLDDTEHKRNFSMPPEERNDGGVPSVVYGGGNGEDESLLNNGTSSADDYGCLVQVDSPPARRQSRVQRGNRFSLSQSLNSFVSPTGELFTFKGGHPETMIIAEDELLPRETPLFGSSKSAANAFNTEMKRIASADGNMLRDRSLSVLSQCTIGSAQTVRTLKEIDEEYLAKTRYV